MTDVRLFQTPDGGDINLVDGAVEMDGGLETAVYLSMFGGTGWWGNVGELEPVRQYNSETQSLLESLPATTGNLRRIEDAIGRDLAWLTAEGVASSVESTASLPGVNLINITVSVDQLEFSFSETWAASIK